MKQSLISDTLTNKILVVASSNYNDSIEKAILQAWINKTTSLQYGSGHKAQINFQLMPLTGSNIDDLHYHAWLSSVLRFHWVVFLSRYLINMSTLTESTYYAVHSIIISIAKQVTITAVKLTR